MNLRLFTILNFTFLLDTAGIIKDFKINLLGKNFKLSLEVRIILKDLKKVRLIKKEYLIKLLDKFLINSVSFDFRVKFSNNLNGTVSPPAKGPNINLGLNKQRKLGNLKEPKVI